MCASALRHTVTIENSGWSLTVGAFLTLQHGWLRSSWYPRRRCGRRRRCPPWRGTAPLAWHNGSLADSTSYAARDRTPSDVRDRCHRSSSEPSRSREQDSKLRVSGADCRSLWAASTSVACSAPNRSVACSGSIGEPPSIATTWRGSSGRAPPRSRGMCSRSQSAPTPVSYTHLRAHETRHDIVCRLLLEKKQK